MLARRSAHQHKPGQTDAHLGVHERTKHESLTVLEPALLIVFTYVDTVDDPVRLHQSLCYKCPDNFDAEHAPVIAA